MNARHRPTGSAARPERVTRAANTDDCAAAPDGRRQRSAHSRRRIVDALITLVRAGNLGPSAEAVSKQADVSLRTVFRHFDDMDNLYQEMAAVVEAEVQPLFAAPLPEAEWPDLLGELIARRSRVFERIMPFKLAGSLRRHQSGLLMRQHLDLNGRQRRVLAAMAPAALREDPALFEALDLLLCFESWYRLRTEQNLSVPKARASLRAACLALTAAAG